MKSRLILEVSGKTGSGKTTILDVVAKYLSSLGCTVSNTRKQQTDEHCLVLEVDDFEALNKELRKG